MFELHHQVKSRVPLERAHEAKHWAVGTGMGVRRVSCLRGTPGVPLWGEIEQRNGEATELTTAMDKCVA